MRCFRSPMGMRGNSWKSSGEGAVQPKAPGDEQVLSIYLIDSHFRPLLKLLQSD